MFLVLQTGHSTVCHSSSAFHSNGPRLGMTSILNLPLTSLGTRHEYGQQLPPQPYAKVPVWSSFPFSSTILTFGAPSCSPFFVAAARYGSPA